MSFISSPSQHVLCDWWRRWCVDSDLREVRPCAEQILGVEGVADRKVRDARGPRGGIGSGYGCHLGCGKLANAAGVVDL